LSLIVKNQNNTKTKFSGLMVHQNTLAAGIPWIVWKIVQGMSFRAKLATRCRHLKRLIFVSS